MEEGEYINAQGPSSEGGSQRRWFCVQTHPKHEHIAAESLAKITGFQVYNPRIRTRRNTRRGLVWFTESLFPGYIFAQFDLHTELAAVTYSASVSKVIHFSNLYPTISDTQLEEMRSAFGSEGTVVLPPEVEPGDTVRIIGGAFHDILAIVQNVYPAKQRVQALFEFLGRLTTVDLDIHRVEVQERNTISSYPMATRG